MGLAQGQHDGVLGGRCLQLEIELSAEAFAQRKAEGAVDSAAEARMNHQLHTAALIEEAFQHQVPVIGERGQCGPGGGEIFNQLRRGRLADAVDGGEPARHMRAGLHGTRALAELCAQIGAKPGNGSRKLVASARSLAEPERHVGRHTLRVFDPHLAGFDAQHPP